jgi:hypothetical protein
MLPYWPYEINCCLNLYAFSCTSKFSFFGQELLDMTVGYCDKDAIFYFLLFL